MDNISIIANPGAQINASIETLWGVTRDQANSAQECIFNPGDVPLTIIIPPMTGIFARIKEKTE